MADRIWSRDFKEHQGAGGRLGRTATAASDWACGSTRRSLHCASELSVEQTGKYSGLPERQAMLQGANSWAADMRNPLGFLIQLNWVGLNQRPRGEGRVYEGLA
jgi:hypothetical protein